MARGHQQKGLGEERQSPLCRLLQTRQIYVPSNGDVQFIQFRQFTGLPAHHRLIDLSWMAYAALTLFSRSSCLTSSSRNYLRPGWTMKTACRSFGPPWKGSMTDCARPESFRKVDEGKPNLTIWGASRKNGVLFPGRLVSVEARCGTCAARQLQIEARQKSTFLRRYRRVPSPSRWSNCLPR